MFRWGGVGGNSGIFKTSGGLCKQDTKKSYGWDMW